MADKIVINRQAITTAVEAQNITDAGLGGDTPNAVITILTSATADGTPADHAEIAVGFATAVGEQRALCFSSEHGAASTDDTRSARPDQLVEFNHESGGHDVTGNLTAFIADGYTIDFTKNDTATAYLLTSIMFSGLTAAKVGTIDPDNTEDGTVDITDVGFEPDLVLIIGNQTNLSANGGADSFFTIGYCLNNLDQRCLSFFENDAEADGLPYQEIFSNRAGEIINAAGVMHGVELSDFDADGFTVTTRDGGPGTILYAYIAIKFSSLQAEAFNKATPTSTGNDSITGLGIQPSFIFDIFSHLGSFDSHTQSALAGAFGFSAMDTNDQISNSVSVEDQAATTNTQSVSNDQAIDSPDDDGSAGLAASLSSFNSDGFTLNFSSVLGTAANQFGFVLGNVAGGGEVVQDIIGPGIIPFLR